MSLLCALACFVFVCISVLSMLLCWRVMHVLPLLISFRHAFVRAVPVRLDNTFPSDFALRVPLMFPCLTEQPRYGCSVGAITWRHQRVLMSESRSTRDCINLMGGEKRHCPKNWCLNSSTCLLVCGY